MNQSESTIQAKIRLALSERGIMTFRMQSGTFLSMDGKRVVTIGILGMSDLLAVLPDGSAAWLETKRAKGGRKAEAQETFIKMMQKQGCKAGFCKSTKEALEIVGCD